MSERGVIVALGIASIGASIGFYLFPGVDLTVSGLFWNGNHFPMAKGQDWAFFTDWLHYGLRTAFFSCAAIASALLLSRRQPIWLTWRKYLFVLFSVALAAGLVTNVVLKDHWGRARPSQVEQFGGMHHFTPAWVISDQCRKNCSFVGGDVSFAFCALAPALLTRRKRWIVAAVALGSITAIGRMAAGGHFLSDCIIAALLTSIIVLVLKQVLRPNEST